MTGCHNRSNDQEHSQLKTVLRKLGDKYLPYCTTYKIHVMTTCHGGTGHTGKDRDLNSCKEDRGGIDIGPCNGNESTVWILCLLLEDQRQMYALVTSCPVARQI